jgi:UDP-N-acetylmuramate dehydrogenase
MTVGGAQVSEKHGNFIINTGRATARDVLQLIDEVRRIVADKTGYVLETEVRLLGREM